MVGEIVREQEHANPEARRLIEGADLGCGARTADEHANRRRTTSGRPERPVVADVQVHVERPVAALGVAANAGWPIIEDQVAVVVEPSRSAAFFRRTP